MNSTKPRMFADDTNITSSGNCIDDFENAVNSDLENLRTWLMANKLSLNVAKTEFQIIGTKQNLMNILGQKPDIHILDCPIKQIVQCTSLGVILDANLSWKSNTDAICKKISSGIYALKRIKPFVDQKKLMSVYNAIIHPYFTYCCEVWDVFGETQSMRLQKLHNRAARIIADVPNDVNQETVLDLLQWETLKTQRLKSKAKAMFKILHGKGPASLKRLFNLKKESLQHNLRDSSNTLRLPKPCSNSVKKSFMYNGASTWNSIPEVIRDSKTYFGFEKKLSALSLKN